MTTANAIMLHLLKLLHCTTGQVPHSQNKTKQKRTNYSALKRQIFCYTSLASSEFKFH